SEPDAGSPVVFVRKVRTSRGARITREQQPNRRVHESLGLGSRNNRERPPFQIEFRRIVFISDSQVDRQALGGPPFVLDESISRFAANIRRSGRGLEKFVGRSEQEIRQRVAGSPAEEIEFPVYDKVENSVVLISRNTSSDFKVVISANQAHGVRETKRVIHQAGRALLAKAKG